MLNKVSYFLQIPKGKFLPEYGASIEESSINYKHDEFMSFQYRYYGKSSCFRNILTDIFIRVQRSLFKRNLRWFEKFCPAYG